MNIVKITPLDVLVIIVSLLEKIEISSLLLAWYFALSILDAASTATLRTKLDAA